jgi:hypothetical protein
MNVLSDKMVVEPGEEFLAGAKLREKRVVTAKFERQAREIIPVVVKRDQCELNPLADALAGVRL